MPTAPTQTRYPWRTVVRTILQVALGIGPMLPLIVDASGIDESLPWVAAALGISAAVTRIMALPAVEAFLQKWGVLSWLAAKPAPPDA